MKQLLRYFLFLITVGAMFSACQKELNFETENAVGILTIDVNGNCAPVMPNGSFVKNVVLDATNYVDVQVNITNVGKYVIKTNTVNGYYFYDSSIVAVLGVNTFRLKGYGTPLAASIDDFTVTFGTTTCSLSNIVLATAGGTTVAQFTLAGSPNACAGSKQTNNFFAGVATAAALNKDTIYVDVTVAGTYTITATTTPSNGLTFSKSGTFTAIGPNQQVILEAFGTPSTAGSIPYTINTTSPASNCGFNLTVLGAATFTMNCGGVTFGGLYREGTPIVAGTNTITIPISGVIANGFYNVTTSTLNGISFAGAGALTPASTSITLYALPGTPITQGSFIYNVAVGGGLPCGIVVNYMAPPPQGTIKCSIGGGALRTFNVNALAKFDNTTLPLLTGLVISGNNNNTDSEAILFALGNTAGGASSTIIPGVYNTNQLASCLILSNYTTPLNVTYGVISGVPVPTPFTIEIQSISLVPPKRVTGKFYGLLGASGGGAGSVTISLGTFDLPIQ